MYQWPKHLLRRESNTNELFTQLGRIYTLRQSQILLNKMINEIEWQTEYFAYGRRFDVPRSQAWFADEGVHYRYSNNLLKSHRWTPLLLGIQQTVQEISGLSFNAVLVTYYRDGQDHVTWHADNETELGDAPFIASLSFGATRQFHYRYKFGAVTANTELHDGELLLMHPRFQQQWEHAVPVQNEVRGARVNLTFRNVVKHGVLQTA